MAEKNTEKPDAQHRRLAAILMADVVGYSRLMASDDAGTLAALKALHKEVVEPLVSSHQGRIVDAPGDCILAEFPSVVESASCAIGIQRTLAKRNEGVPQERQIMLRIGLNLGDVIVSEDKIYGDGINIAARLEPLATPGGICVSRTVYEQIKSKMDMIFESLGSQSVKNIPDPVEVYRIVLEMVGRTTGARHQRHPNSSFGGDRRWPQLSCPSAFSFTSTNVRNLASFWPRRPQSPIWWS